MSGVLQQMLAIFSAGCVMSLAIIVTLRYTRTDNYISRFLPVAALPLLALPVNGLPVYNYIRGIIGDLSIVSQGLVLATVVAHVIGKNLVDFNSHRWLYPVIVVAGIVLYPAALGLGPIDSYQWGFSGLALPVAVLLVTVFMILKEAWFAASLLVVAVLLAGIPAMESRNLWDYLLDPAVFVYALFPVVRKLKHADAGKNRQLI
ncbi:MAG: hypothetical protein OEZ10_02220 [Gammaproteobacteria bacterium]|nr:hypothetical protein [Gammaproteobacteria bacterium]